MSKILNYILTISLIFLFACGYQPILDKKNYQFSIVIDNESGDENINSLIINRFQSQKGKKKEYNLTLISSKKKKIVSKDTKGDPSIFELLIKVEYMVNDKDEILIQKNITKKTTYNNISDKFELEKYEETIIKNLSTTIASDIISSISEINE
tara:strand:- start:1785 stop:2243 length:459 start_codon:yes stop_codon:yes gene_type:complete